MSSLSRFRAAWNKFTPSSSSRSTYEDQGGRPISSTASDSLLSTVGARYEPAPEAVDITHKINDSPTTPNVAGDITHEIYDISPRPIGFGGYSDIYTGTWRSATGETKVAIKVIRAVPMSAESNAMPRALRREISVWKRLQHRNVHALCGLYEGIGPVPALVSPWYQNGDIKSYLQRHVDDSDVNLMKLRLLCDIMFGVKFLHNHSVVHGDIKGQNVLISDAGVATLCDFGLSRILAEHSQSVTYTGVRGTSRWMAPEIFLDGERHSYASDMWACGCLFIEVWNSVLPYHTKINDFQLSLALHAKELPGSPLDMPDTIWACVQECCSFDTTRRPSALQVVTQLCLQLVMQQVDGWVMISRPIDIHVRDLLQGVEASLRGSTLQSVSELYILADSELASEVIRHLSLMSLINAEGPEKLPSEVFHWCLARIGIGSLLVPPSVKLLTADDDCSGRFVEPAKLRPLARILERAHSGLAQLFMDQFSTPAFGRPLNIDRFIGSQEPAKPRIVAKILGRARPGLAQGFITKSLTPAGGLPLSVNTKLMSVAWFSDGNRIVVGCEDATIHIVDASTGESLLRIVGHTDAVSHVAVSPNGRLLASCSDDRSIRLWDAETGLAIGPPMVAHTDWVRSAAFSPDSRHIASGSGDETIRIWSTETCRTVLGPLRAHTGAVVSLAYSPDGSRIVSGSWDQTVLLWDASQGGSPIRYLRGHVFAVKSVSYSSDGLRIVSGSSDCTVRIWDAQTYRLVDSPLEGHVSSVDSVAYSPDGTRIVSGSYDRTVRIWDAATGASIATFQGHTDWVSSIAISPDGSRLASASKDGTVRIWDATDDWKRWNI